MRFTAMANTDIGLVKRTNQDSLLIKHASTEDGEVLLAVVCDGMGGLSKGELASATVVKAFSKWFEEELPYELEHLDMQVIGGKWSRLLKDLNQSLQEYSKGLKDGLGTTCSAILFAENQYVIAHVGDTRIYHIGEKMRQLTTDQTFVAREVSRGTMTLEQAEKDKRRNMLLQCVGASRIVEPEILVGKIEPGAYLMCSDGFRHKITESDMYQYLNPKLLKSKSVMHENVQYLIEQVKVRKERDNISAILIKVE